MSDIVREQGPSRALGGLSSMSAVLSGCAHLKRAPQSAARALFTNDIAESTDSVVLRASMLHMQIIGSAGGILLAFKLAMIHIEPATRNTISTPKAERQHVVGVVRSGGDVQEKHQVNAHLGDREHGEPEGDAGCPEQRRVGSPERRGREDTARTRPIV